MEAPEKLYFNTSDINGVLDIYSNKDPDDSIEYIRKDALVKYLFEEKGYPITLNGELLHWDELNKHLAEYNKWKKDSFIEKAISWLKEQDEMIGVSFQEDFLERFKDYMKGE